MNNTLLYKEYYIISTKTYRKKKNILYNIYIASKKQIKNDRRKYIHLQPTSIHIQLIIIISKFKSISQELLIEYLLNHTLIL